MISGLQGAQSPLMSCRPLNIGMPVEIYGPSRLNHQPCAFCVSSIVVSDIRFPLGQLPLYWLGHHARHLSPPGIPPTHSLPSHPILVLLNILIPSLAQATDDVDEESDFDEDEEEIAENADYAEPGVVKTRKDGTAKGRKKADQESKELRNLLDTTPDLAKGAAASTTGTASAGTEAYSRGVEFDVGATSREESAARSRWTAPQRVVKRITRTIKPNGTEIIEVRFIVSDAEVARVEQEKAKPTRRGVSEGAGRRKSTGFDDQDLFQDEHDNGLKIKVGFLKSKVRAAFPIVILFESEITPCISIRRRSMALQ
jgi:hypothetical protein